MKGFVKIKKAPVEHDNETYYVNIAAISHFHKLDLTLLKNARYSISVSGKQDNSGMPNTIVYLNTRDYEGTQVAFRISETVEEFIKILQAATQ